MLSLQMCAAIPGLCGAGDGTPASCMQDICLLSDTLNLFFFFSQALKNKIICDSKTDQQPVED